MNRKEFDRILDKCLAQLEKGAVIEDILNENSIFAAKLEPLLRAAQTARSLSEPEYGSSMREGRNRLLAEADRMYKSGSFTKNRTKPSFSRYSGQWFKNIGGLFIGKENSEMKLLPRLALYLVMTALIAGFFTVNASASSLPGDLLYEIKLGWEDFRLLLAFDDDFYQELKFKFEAERLDEVEVLLGEGREEDVEFLGLIESMGEGSWVISGIQVLVDTQTEIKGTYEIGDLVKVEALTQTDGSLLALEIYLEGFEDMDDNSDDDMDDDSDDEIDDDSNDDVDDDSDDEIGDGSDDDMDDDSDEEMNDDSKDEMNSSDDDGKSDDSSDEHEEEEEEEESEDKS